MTNPATRVSRHPHVARGVGASQALAPPLPLWRLYVLRFGYLFMGVGLAVVKWPLLFQRDQPWELMEGVVNCILVAMSVLALVGLRYPLQMLPLLLFESAWKLLWLGLVALPLWIRDQLDPSFAAMTFDLAFVLAIVAIIPWDYVVTHYLSKPGDRWRSTAQPRPAIRGEVFGDDT